MCASAFWTVLPWGSSTAFFGVMIILAFMSGGLARNLSQTWWGNQGFEASLTAYRGWFNSCGYVPMNYVCLLVRRTWRVSRAECVCWIETRLQDSLWKARK